MAARTTNNSPSLTFAEAGNLRFTFGKYKRKQISEAPIEYLVWASEGASAGDETFKEAIRVYLSDPQIADEVEEARSRFSKSRSAGKLESTEPAGLLFSFCLPRGNQLEIRLNKRVSADELVMARRFIMLVEDAIVEPEPDMRSQSKPEPHAEPPTPAGSEESF